MNNKECRRYEHRPGFSRPNGKSSVFISCPFCGWEVEAYLWSLAGVGKRCPGCGAMHYYSGKTCRPISTAMGDVSTNG